MTTPSGPSDSEPPQRGTEYPPLENLPPAVDPYAPVDYPAADYPSNYPGPPPGYPPNFAGLPPPVYPGPYPNQYAYGGYDPYRDAVPTGTNGKAIAALVLAVIGLPACMCFIPSLIGLVLGFIAIGETRRNSQAGHGLALSAVIVSGATLIMGIGFMAVSVGGS